MNIESKDNLLRLGEKLKLQHPGPLLPDIITKCDCPDEIVKFKLTQSLLNINELKFIYKHLHKVFQSELIDLLPGGLD